LMLNISGTVRDRDTYLMEYYALLNNVISSDLDWPSATQQSIRWREAWRGLSATAELLVFI